MQGRKIPMLQVNMLPPGRASDVVTGEAGDVEVVVIGVTVIGTVPM